LVGDVDFEAKLASPALVGVSRSASGGGPRRWGKLPGTGHEIAAVGRLFRKRFGRTPDELSEREATKPALRLQAPRHQYLHLATHGFFASEELTPAPAPGGKGATRERPEGLSRSDVIGWHPGLLSGLVLAGANRVPAAGEEDGILTALEVAE